MEKINKISIFGSGTMGHGIAQAFAQGGYHVTLQDILPQALKRANTLIRSSLETMVEAGLVETSEIQAVLDRIHPTTSLEEGCQDADMAIECIVENKEAKAALFQKLDAACPPRTLLISNSSFLNIFEFVKTNRPEKVLIAHWYSPPQIIPLVDVVKGPQTDENNLNLVIDILRKIGKKPVIFTRPVAGYVVSRLQVAFQREVYWLLDNHYLAPRDMDEAAIWGLALRMLVVGVCQRIDFGGLDLSLTLTKQSSQSTPVDYQPALLNDLVQQGALGVKAGRGFYDYQGRSEAEVCHERDIRLIKLLKLLQSTDIAGPVPCDDHQIQNNAD
jgi:3-hydroxybutyryl-CoA dehydrogenase